MNASDETPGGDNQNAVVPNGAAPQDGKKRSIGDRVKGFLKDERVITAAAVVVAVVVAVALIKGQDGREDTENFELFPDPEVEDFEPRPGLEDADRQRRSPPVQHNVSGGPVKLSGGRQASETAKANSRRDTGKDPDPGFTYRERSSRGRPPERAPVN